MLRFSIRFRRGEPVPPKEYIITQDSNPELWNVAVELGWSSDGIGVTLEDAENVTSVYTSHSEPFSFNEFVYFKNVTGFSFEGSGLTSIVIPEGVEELQEGAFKNCTNLTDVVLPSSTTIIGDSTFKDCDKLENINLENITDIDNSSFSGCTSLGSVDLSGLTWIWDYAFNGAAIDDLILPPYSQVDFAGLSNKYFDYAVIGKVYVHCEDRANYEYKFLNATVNEWVDDCPPEYTDIWSDYVWGGFKSFGGNMIWTNGTNIFYSGGNINTQYVLNVENNTWERKVWQGYNYLSSFIWTDGIKLYYSFGSTQLVLDSESDTWSPKEWNGMESFDSMYIWTDLNGNIYYSEGTNQYILNKTNSTWEEKIWQGLTSFDGRNTWTDHDGNVYYSDGANKHYILNETTSTWSKKDWGSSLLTPTNFTGANIWTNGDDIFYSSGGYQFILDKTSSTWSNKEWTGLSNYVASVIWSPTSNPTLRLNNTTFRLLGNFDLPDVSNDNIFYSMGSTQKVLDKSSIPPV